MSYVRNFIDSSTIFTICRTVVGAVLFSITIAGVLTMLLLRPTTWVVTDTSTAESPAQAMRSVSQSSQVRNIGVNCILIQVGVPILPDPRDGAAVGDVPVHGAAAQLLVCRLPHRSRLHQHIRPQQEGARHPLLHLHRCWGGEQVLLSRLVFVCKAYLEMFLINSSVHQWQCCIL